MLSYSNLFANQPSVKRFSGSVSHPIECSTAEYLYDEDEVSDGSDIFYYYKNSGNIIKDIAYQLDESNSCVQQSFGTDDFLCGSIDYHNAENEPAETALRYKAFYPFAYDEILHPNGHDYDGYPLPVVVLFHEGGFKECSTFDVPFIQTMGLELARKAYICLIVEYREGRLRNGVKWTAQQQLATYRGIQDVRGAIKSIIKRNTAFGTTTTIEDYHEGKIKINPDQFFIGGASAGAVITVNTAYLRDQTMINQFFLTSGSSDLTIEQALGGIDENRYFGHTSDWPVIRGVLACWGAILVLSKTNMTH